VDQALVEVAEHRGLVAEDVLETQVELASAELGLGGEHPLHEMRECSAPDTCEQGRDREDRVKE